MASTERAVFVRHAGGHVAEREIPAPGSRRERELSALANVPESGWARESAPPTVAPKRPTKAPTKAVPSELADTADKDGA